VKIPYSTLVRGLAGSLSLEDVRFSSSFEELLVDEVNPVPTEFSLSEFAGQSDSFSFQATPVASGVRPSGSLGGLQVQGPSVVEDRIASARAARFGRLSPSADDLDVAGSGRG
jgi:hypothetical protein